MYLRVGKMIYEIAGKSAIAWAKNFLVGNPSVRVIANPTKAQIGKAKTVTSPPKGLTETQKAARSRESQQEFLKAEEPARKRQVGIQSAREQRRWAERDVEDAAKVVGTLKKRRTKGIGKQSSETGEGLTEVQKAARSRASQQKFLKAEQPARKRQVGIQSAREQRRWAEIDAERKKGGKVGKKKRSSSNHADGNKLVDSLYD